MNGTNNKIKIVFLIVLLGVLFVFFRFVFRKLVTVPLAKTSQVRTIKTMQITSSAFSHNSPIPALYTCDGQGINPPLMFHNIPKDAKSLALIVDDPDAPMGTYVHWVVYNIPPATVEILEGKGIPTSTPGKNSSNNTNFVGPCPPNGQHRYFFKLYALDTVLKIGPGISKDALLEAMQGHILATAELVGVYTRH